MILGLPEGEQMQSDMIDYIKARGLDVEVLQEEVTGNVR